MVARLYLHDPDTIFAARVAQSTFPYPIDSVTFDTVTTGAYGDIEIGMTVFFGSSAGAWDYGISRVRKAATSDTLYIGRSSEDTHWGEVDLADNAYITVVEDFRVWAKIPYIDDDGNVYMDSDVAVGTYTTTPPPIAHAQTAVAATVASGIITVDFTAAGSQAVASGASISSYAWDVGDGSITVGTAASSSITATFPAGFRYVSLTVTDSNGKTHTTRVPVLARDASSDVCIDAFQIDSRVKHPEGQDFAISIQESIASGTYPPGTLALVWDGEPASASDRSNVLICGWLADERENLQAQREGTLKGCQLAVHDVASRLRQIPGFSLSVERDASPSAWREMAGVDNNLMYHYMLHWYSTALEVAPFTLASETFEHFRFDVDGASLYQMVDGLAGKMKPDQRLTCDSHGELRVLTDPMVQAVGSRTATVQAALDQDDIVSMNVTRKPGPRLHWWRAGAIVADTTGQTTVFCTAPGEAPGQGPEAPENYIGLVSSQVALNVIEGHRYARLNREYEPFSLLCVGSSAEDIEPANMTWVTVTTTIANWRGLTLSASRGLPLEVSVDYIERREGSAKRVRVQWEKETDGASAVTYIPPDSPPDPEYDPPSDWYDYDPPTDIFGDGFGRVHVLVNAALATTDDFSSFMPSYDDDSPAGPTVLYDFKLDPYDTTQGYLGTNDGLYKVTGLDTSPAWSQVLSPAQILAATGYAYQNVMSITCSIHARDYVAVAYGAGGRRLYCSFSEDGGATWTTGLISSNFANVAQIAIDHADTEGGSLGLLYAAHNTNSGRQLLKSTDKGATWSVAGTMGSMSSSVSVNVHVPYKDNASGQIVFIGLSTGGWVTTDGGSSFTALPDGTNVKGGLGTYTEDRQKVKHFRTDGTFWTSEDGGSTWTQRSMTGVSGTIYAASGFPSNSGQFYLLTSTGIFVSVDGGESFVDKTGDWAFGFSVTQSLGGTIVPNWT